MIIYLYIKLYSFYIIRVDLTACVSCQLESPRFDFDPPAKCTGKLAVLCLSMVDSVWLTVLDALSLILSRLANFSKNTFLFFSE